MRAINFRKLLSISISAIMMVTSWLAAAAQQPMQGQKWEYPEIKSRGRTRGAEAIDKLAPELRILVGQYTGATRGGDNKRMVFNREQLSDIFGIKTDSRNPDIGVAITLAAGETAPLKSEGAKIYYRSGTTVYGDVPVRALERIAKLRNVLVIATANAVSIPTPPQPPAPPIQQPLGALRPGNSSALPQTVTDDNVFNPQGLTGKGVIIGVIDTGIDWRHKDFIRPDGTSRILYLWDQMDTSFADSNGRIGTAPPKLTGGEDPGPGTLYTNEQINAALKGRATVNSMDNFGHGTAAAGTVAGNGLATANGVPPRTYAGVAPEADLIIVKAADCGGFNWKYLLGTVWIAQIAKDLGRPSVINHSLGGHYTAHDGLTREELVMNGLVGAGKPGLAITVSAGNEGQYSMHASGRFGPRQPGQNDFEGAPIEIFVSPYRTEQVAWISAYFDHADDWGIVLVGSGNFLVDEQGKPLRAYIYKYNDAITVQLQKGAKKPDYFDDFAESIESRNTQLALPGDHVDQLLLPLPPGAYWVKGFGSSEKVKTGRFDLYAPDTRNASALFTFGAEKRRMVGSPGNASNVITVAAYDFRERWANWGGQQTLYNLGLSDISDYSSPGGLREDGVFKPEIAAPATYTISSLSSAAAPDGTSCNSKSMGARLGPTAVTRDGFHLAWSGTSASAPFTAGVIALMLQKNPTLDSQQIKQILIRTAIKDDKYVGAAPNPEWGYGKINPAAAIAAVPSPRRERGRTRRP